MDEGLAAGRGRRDGGGGEIDASISTQVQRIVEALLPGEAAKPAAAPQPSAGAEGVA